MAPSMTESKTIVGVKQETQSFGARLTNAYHATLTMPELQNKARKILLDLALTLQLDALRAQDGSRSGRSTDTLASWHDAGVGDNVGPVEQNILKKPMDSNVTRRKFLCAAGVATVAAASLPSALAQGDKKITIALV